MLIMYIACAVVLACVLYLCLDIMGFKKHLKNLTERNAGVASLYRQQKRATEEALTQLRQKQCELEHRLDEIEDTLEELKSRLSEIEDAVLPSDSLARKAKEQVDKFNEGLYNVLSYGQETSK